jgi:mannose-6-phosphate isomerase-like protein (cupin superfamily)
MLPEVKHLPSDHDVIAPDGMEVRLLAEATRGGMAHFRLPPRRIGRAVTHKTVEELWFFLSGSGRMWLSDGEPPARIVDVYPGVALSIPVGTHFQLRNDADIPLDAVGVTMGRWPGEDEAVIIVGEWDPTV